MKKTLRLGDIVQIEYSNKVVGYLFKEDEDSVTICNTLDFEDESPTKTVLKAAIKGIETFESALGSTSAAPVPAPIKDMPKEEMGKVIQFPSKGDDVS